MHKSYCVSFQLPPALLPLKGAGLSSARTLDTRGTGFQLHRTPVSPKALSANTLNRIRL